MPPRKKLSTWNNPIGKGRGGGGGGGGGGLFTAVGYNKGGKIAKTFRKSNKSKGKSLEYVREQERLLIGKDEEEDGEEEEDDEDTDNDDADYDIHRDKKAKTMTRKKKNVYDPNATAEADEKHYTFDLGELQKKISESGRQTGTRNRRIGYVSAKGKMGMGNKSADLAELDLADEETVRNLLSSLPVSHYKEREKKAKDLELQYPTWFRYLTHDFSVLLYGFGSKKAVLEDFAVRYLLDGAVVVVNGYQQRVSALTILNQCVFALSDESESLQHSNNNNTATMGGSVASTTTIASNASALIRRISELTTDNSGSQNYNHHHHAGWSKEQKTELNNVTGGDDYGNGNSSLTINKFTNNTRNNAFSNRGASSADGASSNRLYLVVHNIDGLAMRNAETQTILGELSALPRVHLIASVDHVNAPLLWSKREVAKFNWIYQKAVTFAPYSKETANEPQLLASKGEERHVRGAANVLKSLTKNARIIYRIIAEAQIGGGQGLTFPQLFLASRESFLVTAELALRGVLTEFSDHELIKIKKMSDGGEDLITVPMDNAALEQLVEEECEESHNFF